MTPLSMQDARKLMFKAIREAMLGIHIVFDGRQDENTQQEPVEITVKNARVYLRPASGPQTSIGGTKAIWENQGTLWVQCFGPLSDGRGLEDAEELAIIASNVLRSRSLSPCIHISNVRPDYIGPSGGWYQINVLATYKFDELR